MDSFTIELVSNASGETFPNNTLSSLTNFLPEQKILEGQWEVAFSEIAYPSRYQNITEGNFKFFDEKRSKTTSNYNLQNGLYTSITDIVEAMNTLIQERNNHNETCITVKVSRRSQKVVIMLANDSSGLAFCSTDLGHIFGNNVGNQFGVLMKRKGPNEPLHPRSLIVCLDMEQFVLVPASVFHKSVTAQPVTKQQLPKYKAEQPPTYQIDSLNLNKKLFGKADTLIDKILSCSRIKHSNLQSKILDGVDTGVLISDFTLHRRRKNSDVPDIYFTLLDTAGISPSLVFNQNAKAKERGSWVLFKVKTSEAEKTVYAKWCCLGFCTQLGKT